MEVIDDRTRSMSRRDTETKERICYFYCLRKYSNVTAFIIYSTVSRDVYHPEVRIIRNTVSDRRGTSSETLFSDTVGRVSTMGSRILSRCIFREVFIHRFSN